MIRANFSTVSTELKTNYNLRFRDRNETMTVLQLGNIEPSRWVKFNSCWTMFTGHIRVLKRKIKVWVEMFFKTKSKTYEEWKAINNRHCRSDKAMERVQGEEALEIDPIPDSRRLECFLKLFLGFFQAKLEIKELIECKFDSAFCSYSNQLNSIRISWNFTL